MQERPGRPKLGDVVVTEHRGKRVRRDRVVTGIAASAGTLSTVRHAADADYRLVVVVDCCSDGDAEVHRVLTEKVFARQTTVATAEAVVAVIG